MLVLICCVPIQTSHAQTVEAMIKRFKKCENAEHHRISGVMLGMIRMLMPNNLSIYQQIPEEELQKILDENNMTKEEFMDVSYFLLSFIEQTKSLAILSLENCSEEDCQRFLEATAGWVPEGFATEDGEEGVYVKKSSKRINEIVIVNREPDDCSIMTLKGDLSPEFIANAEQSMEQIFSKMTK